MPPIRSLIIDQIEHQFEQNFDSHLEIESISGLIPFSGTIHEISIKSNQDSTNVDVIAIKSIYLDIEFLSLLKGEINFNEIQIYEPVINLFKNDSLWSIQQVFQSHEDASDSINQKFDTSNTKGLDESLSELGLPEAFVSNLNINNGTIAISNHDLVKFSIPDTIQILNINANLFSETDNDQVLVELRELNLGSNVKSIENLSLSTQMIASYSQLEFNELNLSINEAFINGNTQIYGSDSLNLAINSASLTPSNWSNYLPELNQYDEKLDFNMSFRKIGDAVQVPVFKLVYPNANIDLSFALDKITDIKSLAGNVKVNQLSGSTSLIPNAYKSEIPDWLVDEIPFEFKGLINLNKNILTVDLKQQREIWPFNIKANVSNAFDIQKMNIVATVDLDKINSTDLVTNFPIQFDSLKVNYNGNPFLSKQEIDANIFQIRQKWLDLNRLSLSIKNDSTFFESQIELKKGETLAKLNSTLNLKEQFSSTRGELAFEQFDIQDFVEIKELNNTNLDGKLVFDLNGATVDDVYGFASLDISKAIIENDSIAPHQIYVDLNSPVNVNRNLRLTSTFLDLELEGHLVPTDWYKWLNSWQEVLIEQTKDIFVASDTVIQKYGEIVFDSLKSVNTSLSLKNLDIINSYLKQDFISQSNTNFNSYLEAGNGSLLVRGNFNSDSIAIDQNKIDSASTSFTLNFKNLNNILDNSSVVIRTDFKALDLFNQSFRGVNSSITQEDFKVETLFKADSINTFQNILAQVRSEFTGKEIKAVIDTLKLNVNSGTWKQDGMATITFDRSNSITVSNISAVNNKQRIEVNGTFSPNETDSVIYAIQEVKINDLLESVDLKFDLSGRINANFTTKTLTEIPQFIGEVKFNQLRINQRPVGDVSLKSNYEFEKDRFNIKSSIQLDSSKYADYYVKNNKIGNDIRIGGYFNRPNESFINSDTLYSFNADIKQLDMWMINYFIPEIYEKMEGRGDGGAYFNGGLGWIDFSVNIDLDSVLTVPKFLLSNIFMDGELVFGFHEGLLFENMRLFDGEQGTGTISGMIDMDYFGDNRSYDIRADLRQFVFLDNSYEPGIPFYGKAAGTGSISLTGPISKPFLSTVQPVITTPNSRLSIPLIDIETVESQTRFIEFVNSFSDTVSSSAPINQQIEGLNPIVKVKGEDELITTQKTFSELFQLNLQFTTPDQTDFELVFDPVTGEILKAQGGGNMNITLEDQEVKMYGIFDVFGGNYNFVGGDVFSRNFAINDGGTIAWEGAPDNPRINLTSVFRSRPNYAPINGQDTRIPTDLILKISGSIEQLQNDFYFEIPNVTFQDASLNAALRLLNSEDQKLAQATSLLLTGNFFATNEAGSSFGQNTNATQAGLSQLLSNQINTLLNNSISNLDIDLNLNGFEQADLGIALRLFDDRLVLKREGQITPNQTGTNQNYLGDLGASYRISRALSVEVFYRQDPTVGAFGAVQDQAQLVSGVGLQYQVEFNSWRDLPGIIWNNILDFFGIKRDTTGTDESNQNITALKGINEQKKETF